jgi:hypothetical protein
MAFAFCGRISPKTAWLAALVQDRDRPKHFGAPFVRRRSRLRAEQGRPWRNPRSFHAGLWLVHRRVRSEVGIAPAKDGDPRVLVLISFTAGALLGDNSQFPWNSGSLSITIVRLNLYRFQRSKFARWSDPPDSWR